MEIRRANLPTSTVADSWVRAPLRLKYLLGEIRLFSVTFPSLIFTAPFSELMQLDGAPPLPFTEFPAGLALAKIPSCPVKEALPRISKGPQGLRYVPTHYRRFFVRFEGGFETYLAKFSSKTRSTLQRKVKKLRSEPTGDIEWREYRGERQLLDEFHEPALRISEKTYQERLFGGGLPTKEVLTQELAALEPGDSARGYLLFESGKPIAYLFCPILRGNVIYRYVGHDPAFAPLSPGTVLLYLVLEKLFAETGLVLFDFTEGAGAHKELFANGSALCADVLYFRPTLSNYLWIGLHTISARFSAGIVFALDKLGLKARIKKLFRAGIPSSGPR